MMNNKNVDKRIKSKIDIPNDVPDNINRIFDNFIDENLQTNLKSSKIKEFNVKRRIATITSSILATVATGGVVYAVATGMDIGKIFNINQENYEKEIVNVQEEVLSENLNLKLESYAIDHNAIVVNYVVKAENDEKLSITDENIVVDTLVNGEIALKITSQATVYDKEINGYRISTLYAIEKFEDTLDTFTMDIWVKEIFGKEGNWKFNLAMDKSNKEDNRTYLFKNEETGVADRFAVKTNYLPIGMSIDDISISNFSNVANITIVSYPFGVPEYNTGNPREIYEASEDARWKEKINLKLEVVDSNGNVLYKEYFDFVRDAYATIEGKKIIFPNVTKNVENLTFNVYLINNEKQEELAGTKEIEMEGTSDTSSKRFKLDKTQSYKEGNVDVEISSKWQANETNGILSIMRASDFGTTSEIQISKLNDEALEYWKNKGADISSEQNLAKVIAKQTLEEPGSEGKIINEGKTTMGEHSGYQIVLNSKFGEGEFSYSKEKLFVFKLENKIYLTSLMVDSDEEYEICKGFFDDVVASIKLSK